MAKRGKVGGSFFSAFSANKRTYQKVYSSNVTSRVVPKACAIVRSGRKKGKLKRGCKFSANGHVYCDVVVADKIKCKPGAKMPKRRSKRHRAERDVRPTAAPRRHRRRRLPSGERSKQHKKSLQYREGRGYVMRGIR